MTWTLPHLRMRGCAAIINYVMEKCHVLPQTIQIGTIQSIEVPCMVGYLPNQIEFVIAQGRSSGGSRILRRGGPEGCCGREAPAQF